MCVLFTTPTADEGRLTGIGDRLTEGNGSGRSARVGGAHSGFGSADGLVAAVLIH